MRYLSTLVPDSEAFGNCISKVPFLDVEMARGSGRLLKLTPITVHSELALALRLFSLSLVEIDVKWDELLWHPLSRIPYNATATINQVWAKSKRDQFLKRSNKILVRRYGLPSHGNKFNPLDEVIYIILSSQTDEKKYQAVYCKLKRAFPSWKTVAASDESRIEQILRPAGFSKVKAKRLIALLQKLDLDFGKRSLSALRKMDNDEAEEYLRTLPGVGLKTARCVLLYSLGRDVYPVDTHNFRILRRLGVFDLPAPIRRWHNEIQKLIPEELRYSLHVTLVSLGRDICKASSPQCRVCPLDHLCCYAQRRNQFRQKVGH